MSARYRYGWCRLLGDSFIMLTNLLFLYIWWQALRTAPVRRQSGVTL